MVYSATEDCDDGNKNDNDGCTNKCTKANILGNVFLEIPEG